MKKVVAILGLVLGAVWLGFYLSNQDILNAEPDGVDLNAPAEVGDLNEQPDVVDQIGLEIAEYATCRLIYVDEIPVIFEGINVGGCSEFHYLLACEPHWDRARCEQAEENSRIVQANLRQLIEQSDCDVADLLRYTTEELNVSPRIIPEEEFAEAVSCLGEVTFGPSTATLE